MYINANNLYKLGMSQKLHVNGFSCKKIVWTFNEDFIKSYDANSDKWYVLEVDVNYPKNIFNLHSDLPLLGERKKIKE